jgi:hypothetical protein
MPKRSRRSPSTRKPGTSTPPVTALVVSAVARSAGGSLHLHISVMRSDGSPVTGLSCGNFQVRIGYDVFPTSMQPVPTTSCFLDSISGESLFWMKKAIRFRTSFV